MPRDKVLIVGVGNELLGDEGLGVHVARTLLTRTEPLPSHLEVLEAGTALLDLLPSISHYSRVILVDAVRAGRECGSVCSVDLSSALDGSPKFSLPASLHQWGLMDTLRTGRILGLLPGSISLIGAEPEIIAPGVGLSPKLAMAAERIISLLLADLP
ncbi:MAG: hydrogenase maturation protease [Acidobacteria bacterium]|nr:hydrogenase maturation protease [Acidobacteriota bacterium]